MFIRYHKQKYNIVTNTLVKKLSRNATDGHVCADEEDAEAQSDTWNVFNHDVLEWAEAVRPHRAELQQEGDDQSEGGETERPHQRDDQVHLLRSEGDHN